MSIGARVVKSIRWGFSGFVVGWTATSIPSAIQAINSFLDDWNYQSTLDTQIASQSAYAGCPTRKDELGQTYPVCPYTPNDPDGYARQLSGIYRNAVNLDQDKMYSALTAALSSIPGVQLTVNAVAGTVIGVVMIAASFIDCKKEEIEEKARLISPLTHISVAGDAQREFKSAGTNGVSLATSPHRMQYGSVPHTASATHTASDAAEMVPIGPPGPP